jgi:hypothetical protein
MVKLKTSKGNILINPDNIIAIKSNSTGDGIEIMFTNTGSMKREYYNSDITFDEVYKSLGKDNNNFIKLKACQRYRSDTFHDILINRHKIDLVNYLDEEGSTLTVISTEVYQFTTDSTVDEVEDMIKIKKSLPGRLL